MVEILLNNPTSVLVKLTRDQTEKIFAHARSASPRECCGLVGGCGSVAQSIYRLTNIAPNPLIAYEAAAADLFKAQREMRQRSEQLLAIYHSHPRSPAPLPSQTDIAQAFYPDVVYFIIGCDGSEYVLRGFRLYESERRWERADFIVTD